MYSCKLPLLIIRCNELCCASKSEPFLVSCFITTFQQQQQQINVSTIPCMRYKCYSARPCIFMVTLTYRDDSFDSGSEKLPGLSQMFPSKGAGAFLVARITPLISLKNPLSIKGSNLDCLTAICAHLRRGSYC